MAYLIEQEQDKPKKQYKIRLPDIVGKFGFSLELGRKQLFFGFAIAEVEIETITRKKKVKVFKRDTKTRFMEL